MLTEIGFHGNGTFAGIRKFRRKCKMCLMYTEGFDQVDGSTTSAVKKEMAARGESATSACTSTTAVSVLGSLCASVACCSAACKI